MMAMTILQHNLAFYDAGKTQPPLVIDRQNSQDWYVMYHPGIRINLDSCRGQPSNPQLNVEGVDRINSVDAKLYDRPPGHLQVRANAYVLKTSGMNTAEFTQKHILPNLQCPPAPPSPLSTAPSVELLRAKRKELSQLNRIGLHNLTKRHSHLSSPQSNLTRSDSVRTSHSHTRVHSMQPTNTPMKTTKAALGPHQQHPTPHRLTQSQNPSERPPDTGEQLHNLNGT